MSDAEIRRALRAKSALRAFRGQGSSAAGSHPMPVVARKGRLATRLFRSTLPLLAWLTVLGLCGPPLRAQTIRIMLVDGRNGRAMAKTCVNVWVGNERKSAMAIPTDKDGVASLRLTRDNAQVSTRNQWRGCGDFGVIGPVVKYSGSIRINAGYVLCQVRRPDHTWLAIQTFPAEEVLRSGVVTANTCGKARATPTPGEIVIFVRPLNWWEKLKE